MKNIFILLLFCLLTAQIFGQEVLKNIYSANGQVNDVKIEGGVAYICGDFDYVGPNTGPAGIFDEFLDWDPSFPQIRGTVNCAYPDSYGGWYIGGDFYKVGDFYIENLAHILNDNTVDSSFSFNPNGQVRTMVMWDNYLIFGGIFAIVVDSVNEENNYHSLAAVDLEADTLTDWNPRPLGSINTLEARNDKIWIGGSFDEIAGDSLWDLVSYDPVNDQIEGIGQTFYKNGEAFPFVNDILFKGNKIYVGGSFDHVGDKKRKNLVAFDEATWAITDWAPDTLIGGLWDSQVTCLEEYENIIYVGGDFTGIGESARKNLAAIEMNTGLVTDWDPQASAKVRALKRDGTKLFVGGDFTLLGLTIRKFIAKFDLTTGEQVDWDINAQNRVISIEIENSVMFLGGSFTSIGGVLRKNLAAIDLVNGKPTYWMPNTDYPVYTIDVSGDKVYAGGAFSTIGGVQRNHIARIDKSTGFVDSWAPEANDVVYSLKISNGKIYAGGEFTIIGGAERNYLAELDSETGNALLWDPQPDGAVYKIDINGDVYIAGLFQTVGSVSRPFLSAIDASSGTATSWAPNPDNRVTSIFADNDKIYAGGIFNHIGNESRNFAASLDPVTAQADSWAPNPDNAVMAITKSNDRLYLGGMFGQMSNEPRPAIASFNLTTGELLPWNPVVIGTVIDLAYSNDVVYAGGSFNSIGDAVVNNFGAIYDTTSITDVEIAKNSNIPSEFVLYQNYPNPFNPTTTIKYSMPVRQVGIQAAETVNNVLLKIYDILGREITTLVNEKQSPGNYEVTFDASNLPSGVYLYRLTSGHFNSVKKLILLK